MAAALRIRASLLFSLFCFSLVHSREYKIIQNGDIETMSGSCNFKNVKFVEHNETWLSITGQLQLGQEIKEGVKVDLIGYEKRGKTYRKHALLHTKNQDGCSYLKSDKYQKIAKNNNLPTQCPLAAKTYTVNQIWIDISKMPQAIPGANDGVLNSS